MEKKCNHEHTSKEYIFDQNHNECISTGDYICDLCGEVFSINPNKK